MYKKLFFLFGALLILGILGFSKNSSTKRFIPDTKEAHEIMKMVENAYAIEVEAAHTFDMSKFPTVFINDPHFPVDPYTLQVVREMTNNPSLESAGWLDYKLAYYSWRKGATLQFESVQAKAKAENRDLTSDEKKALVDSHGRVAPARAQGTIEKPTIQFLSVDINDDVALVVVNDGPTTAELTLVLVDGQWYIAAFRGISIHP